MPGFARDHMSWSISALSEEQIHIGRTAVPAGYEVTLTHPDWPAKVVLSVAVTLDRGPVAVGLKALSTAEPISYRDADDLVGQTVDDMRDELQEMTRSAVVQDRFKAVCEPVMAEELTTPAREERFRVLGEAARLEASSVWGEVRPRRRRMVTRQHLEEVAATYREAVRAGLPPTQAVADRFVRSHSTAARWVGQARHAGVLGPARGTRAGEATA